jgi:hypothetical protein
MKEVVKSRFGSVLLILGFLVFPVLAGLSSISAQVKPLRQTAIETFSGGDYEKAYTEFKELLKLYSKDPLYKYYSGVCLVKLNREPDEAVELLSQALKGAAIVKTLPTDAMFYLGRAQHLSGNFSEAADSYIQFSGLAGKKVARELGVQELIQQCEDGEKAAIKKNPAESEKNDLPVISIKETPEKPKQIPSVLPLSYDRLLDEALLLQFKADSVNSVVEQMKLRLNLAPAAEKASFRSKISETEALAASFQSSADKKYEQAQLAMSPAVENAGIKEVVTKSEPVILVVSQKPDEKLIINNSVEVPDDQVVKTYDIKGDTTRKGNPQSLIMQGSLVCFEIVTEKEKIPQQKIVIDGDIPAGLIYRIQVAVFRNPVASEYFNGINPVYGFKVTGTDKTNYYAGMFRKSEDAAKALSQVRTAGFKDAFTVAFSGNKPVSSDRARLLEKEWGNIPFPVFFSIGTKTPADTVTPSLIFRVEIIRTLKPLKPEDEEAVVKLAGSRGIDILTSENGTIVYLIGKFITFESAAEYADLLVRNGYREARVAAFMGRKEISVDTARRLFENIE